MSKFEDKKSALIRFTLPDCNGIFSMLFGNDISIDNKRLVDYINSRILIEAQKQVAQSFGKDVSADVSLYNISKEGTDINVDFCVNLEKYDVEESESEDTEKEKEQQMSNLGVVDEYYVDLAMPKVEGFEEIFGDDISISNDKLVDYIYSQFISKIEEELLQALDISPNEENINLDICEIEDRGEFIVVKISAKLDYFDTYEEIEDFLVCCDTLDECISLANAIIIDSEFKNTLYKHNDKYYFYFDENLTAKFESIIIENMGEVSFDELEIASVLEHGEVIIENEAFQKLSNLK